MFVRIFRYEETSPREHTFFITVPRVGAKAMIMGPGTILGVKMWKNLKKHSEGKKTLVITGTPPIDR